VSTVTITQTASPSRSKMAGPCWIAIGDVYAGEKPRTITAASGDKITVTGKAQLRRKTRSTVERQTWTLYATGDPADTVTVGVGTGQSGHEVQAVITGVSETKPEEPPAAAAIEHAEYCPGGQHCYCPAGDLVPGYADSADGRADAADQAKWDRESGQASGIGIDWGQHAVCIVCRTESPLAETTDIGTGSRRCADSAACTARALAAHTAAALDILA